MYPHLRRLIACLFLLVESAAHAGLDPQWVEFPALKEFNGGPVELGGWLYRPEGRGPFPALVLLHGCGGMYTAQGHLTASYRHWGALLSEEGYVTLLVDSFNPRGYGSICNLQKRPILASRERVEDAYAALHWLTRQPEVAPGRVGLIGWSNGGTGTLYAMRSATQPQEDGFRAAVAFYPGCSAISKARMPYMPYAPLLILIGEADDWTPAASCKQVADQAKAIGAPLDIVTYPGAHHGFDRIDSPVRYRPDVRNVNRPDRLGATVGGHPQARTDAIGRTQAFLARVLKN